MLDNISTESSKDNHLYRYGQKNPVLTIDPFGLCDITCQIADNAAGLKSPTPADLAKQDCFVRCLAKESAFGQAADFFTGKGLELSLGSAAKKAFDVATKFVLGPIDFVQNSISCAEDCECDTDSH